MDDPGEKDCNDDESHNDNPGINIDKEDNGHDLHNGVEETLRQALPPNRSNEGIIDVVSFVDRYFF